MRQILMKALNNPNLRVINYKDYSGKFIYDDCTKKFFKDLKKLKKYYKDQHLAFLPQYVYGTCLKSVKLDLDYMLTVTYEDCTDDVINFIEDGLNGVEELKEAVNRFNEANKEVRNYWVDLNTIVKLNWRNKDDIF